MMIEVLKTWTGSANEGLVQQLTESDKLDSEKIESTAEETAEKCSKTMETYLGEYPDT